MALGIDNLKKVVGVVAALGNVIDKMDHESGVAAKLAEAVGLINPILQLPGIDWSQVKAEIMDLDPAERAELLQDFDADFSLVDKDTEAKVENVISAASSIVDAVVKSIAAVKAFKNA